MTKHCKYFFFCFIALNISGLSFRVKAQNLNDTLSLPEFEIKSDFIIDNQGFKRIKMDSTLFIPNLSADLSSILSQHSSIFIKSYGNGTLATPSFRGTSAQHTQVEWNGINLNSPMLGQMDFSQVPVAQFDGLEILYGAAGISRTSGAFGGVVDLVTSPDWNNQFKSLLAQTFASFENFITNVNVAVGSRFFQSHTKFNYASALNNFPFTNDLGTIVRQKNASFIQFGLSQELFWKLKDRHLFSAKIWYSQDDRNLPPTVQNYDSLKVETINDKALRAVIEYKYIETKWNLFVRSALNDQYMKYRLNDYIPTHRSYSWINRIRYSYVGIRNLTMRPGVDFICDWVNSGDYLGIKKRITSSFFIETSYNFTAKLKSSLILRDDLIDGKFSPLIPALGIEYRPFKKLNLAFSANAARNYRSPTLNDLYWKVGGNPDLRPEENYSVEGGSTYNISAFHNTFYIEASVAGYYLWIYDMITWSPVEGKGGRFQPENIDEIHSRGLELGLNLNLLALGFKIGLKNNYNNCHSTYEKANSTYINNIGKQQFYIPVHLFNSTLSIERWKCYLTYNFVYTSDRFTSKDNFSLMPAYNLSNIILGKNIQLKLFVLSLQIDINNLFNLDYQSIASRPMPGINYAFTLKLAFPGASKN